MRTRYLIAFVVLCDLLMMLAGVPLERASWLAVAHHSADRTLLSALLVGNLALLAVCLLGFYACAVAGARGVRFAFTRFFARIYAQPRRES